MSRRCGIAWRLVAMALVITGCGATTAPDPPPTDPLGVVTAFTDARNQGDLDTALGLLGSNSNILGIALSAQDGKARLRTIFEAQQIANWVVEDDDCAVDGVVVTCRYRESDDILRRWGMALTGDHRYDVRDGRIMTMRRTHDEDAQQTVYAATDPFHAWIGSAHPDLLPVIWIDPTSALYTTPDGARAILGLLDEYDAAVATQQP
jgi:limonene-1,2-epoxide hydrolase